MVLPGLWNLLAGILPLYTTKHHLTSHASHFNMKHSNTYLLCRWLEQSYLQNTISFFLCNVNYFKASDNTACVMPHQITIIACSSHFVH